MCHLLRSVHYIHNTGMIHRDLKPENIMLVFNEDSNLKMAKIIDFGLAKFINRKADIEIEEMCGTPNYLAPEVLKGENPVEASDVFSLGVILYFMLRGMLPFDSFIPDEIISNTINGEYTLDDLHWDNVSSDAKDLLKKLLENNPSSRISLKEAENHPWIKVYWI